MDLELLKANWEAFGDQDPLWAILTDPARRGGRWDLAEFLKTGEDEVAAVFNELETFGISVPPGRALDFGCGVGRLTQALATRFERCDGVDIAASMIAEAHRINRRPEHVHYHVNAAADLSLFESRSFDFVLSFITLQHMEAQYAARYLSEFIRVLKVGGIAVFQLPTGRRVEAAPLVPEAFRATLELAGESPRMLSADDAAPIQVRVRNDSSVAWPADALLTIGGKWYAGAGQFVGEHDARALLPAMLAPGEELVVETAVRAPAIPGEYRLELDLVHEPEGWFAQHGSAALTLTIQVTPGKRSHAGAESPTPRAQPVMEMHGMSPEQVQETLESVGAVIIGQSEDTRGGPLIEGFRYIAQRISEDDPAGTFLTLDSLDAALAAIPSRYDMFPPVISRRSGPVAELELRVRRALGRVLRPVTWVQAEHNRAVRRALHDVRAVLEAQEDELRRLRRELTRERNRHSRD